MTWFNEHFPGLDADDVHEVADALVRLTVSHVVLPSADASLTGERISRIALRYLGADPARPFTQRRFLSGC